MFEFNKNIEVFFLPLSVDSLDQSEEWNPLNVPLVFLLLIGDYISCRAVGCMGLIGACVLIAIDSLCVVKRNNNNNNIRQSVTLLTL